MIKFRKKGDRAWRPKKPFTAMRARSRRIELRAYTPGDFAAWREGHLGRSAPRTRFDGPKPRDAELTRALFARKLREFRQKARAGEGFTFGIFERKTGRIVGFIGYNLISAKHRWANLGYAVHNQHWGKGYGPEAARLCLELGFGPLDFHRIEASCNPRNVPSAKTARRAGLREEGLRRKFFLHDEWEDLLVFGENQVDYRQRRRGGARARRG